MSYETFGTCDRCQKNPSEYALEGGRRIICHECAHIVGHPHSHEDLSLKALDHFHVGRVKTELIVLHIREFREAHPI